MSRKRKWKPVTIGSLALALLATLFSCLHDKGPGANELRPTTLTGHTFPVQALAFGPDGTTLNSVACYLGATQTGVEVATWDAGTGDLVTKCLEHPGAIRCRPTFSPDGRRLAAAIGEDASVGDREVVLWDVRPWRERPRLAAPGLFGNSIALSDDGAQLATTDFQGGITIWDTVHGRSRASCKGEAVASLAFTPCGALLACGTHDFIIRLWNPATGEAIGALHGHERLAFALAFSPDGRHLASGDNGGTVKLWDVAARALRATLPVSEDQLFKDEVLALAFSPDGGTLAVAVNRVVQLWDVATGKRLARLEEHQGKVKCLAFSPDGTRLASGSYDQTVRLWDVARLQMSRAGSR
jgi:WD40 repeat protein